MADSTNAPSKRWQIAYWALRVVALGLLLVAAVGVESLPSKRIVMWIALALFVVSMVFRIVALRRPR